MSVPSERGERISFLFSYSFAFSFLFSAETAEALKSASSRSVGDPSPETLSKARFVFR